MIQLASLLGVFIGCKSGMETGFFNNVSNVVQNQYVIVA